MSAPAGDPIFVLAAAIGEALIDVRIIRACERSEGPVWVRLRLGELERRLQAAEQISLDIPVEANPNQEVLL